MISMLQFKSNELVLTRVATIHEFVAVVNKVYFRPETAITPTRNSKLFFIKQIRETFEFHLDFPNFGIAFSLLLIEYQV